MRITVEQVSRDAASNTLSEHSCKNILQMEFKQALSVQLKFLHLHDKVLTAAFTHKKKETDRRLTPARTTLAVAASTIRRSENI